MILKDRKVHKWTPEQVKKAQEKWPEFFSGHEFRVNYVPTRIKIGRDGMRQSPPEMYLVNKVQSIEDNGVVEYVLCDRFTINEKTNELSETPNYIFITHGMILSQKKHYDLAMFLMLLSPEVQDNLCDPTYRGEAKILFFDKRTAAYRSLDGKKEVNKVSSLILDVDGAGVSDTHILTIADQMGYQHDGNPIIARSILESKVNDPEFRATFLSFVQDPEILELRNLIAMSEDRGILNYDKIEGAWDIHNGEKFVLLTKVNVSGKLDPVGFLAKHLSGDQKQIARIKEAIGINASSSSIELLNKTIADFKPTDKNLVGGLLVNRTQAEFDHFFSTAETKWHHGWHVEFGTKYKYEVAKKEE